LWEVIENGNAPPITKLVKGVETIIAPTIAEEKVQRRLELKARNTLLMGISNEHQLKFNSIKDANTSSTNGTINTALDATTASTQATAVNSTTIDNLSDAVADGYANNEGKEILEEHWKEVFCEWALRNQENRNRENTRSVPVETTTSNVLISCDGLGGYDLSDQAEEGPTNFALTAYSSTSSNSEVSTDSNCLESVEARLLVCKKNKSVYEEDIKVLKREIHLREVAIIELRRKLELAQKQKDEIQLTVENFKNSSKNLSKLLDCQIVDKCKIGLGNNAVPPPYTRIFMPPKPDLSFSGLEEFVNEPIVSEPIVKKPLVETSVDKASEAKPKSVRKSNGAPIIEEWVSDSEEEDVPQAKIKKKTVKSSFAKIEFVKSKEQVKSSRKIVSQGPLTTKNSNFNQRVNTVSGRNVNIARPIAVVNAARIKAVLNAVKGNQVNPVKALACWVWKPKTKVIDHVSKHNNASTILKRFEETCNLMIYQEQEREM
ncbi:hypothetical protein Tco_1435213, partial [Tanacetum coccineum]